MPLIGGVCLFQGLAKHFGMDYAINRGGGECVYFRVMPIIQGWIMQLIWGCLFFISEFSEAFRDGL